MDLVICPATPDHWNDLEDLFGDRGACGGCWCMAWRLTNREFEAGKGEPNRQRLRNLVAEDRQPGVVGYVEGEPVAWCAVAPRSEYGFLARSRVLAAVDEEPVWSISCLFVDRAFRRRGISTEMIRGAAAFAFDSGATTVEAYPIDPGPKRSPDAFVWTGLLSAYFDAGFDEVARRSPTRPIVRLST